MAIGFVLIIGAYLLGSVPAAYLVAKWSRAIDIRQYGSGNVGVGNLLGLTSRWLTIPVIIFDLGKGMAMVWAAQLLGLGITHQVTVGLAVIIGHNWPVFLRFSGGRGVLTTLGVVFILMPWGIAVFMAIASFTIWTKSSPLPVLAGITALPLASWGLEQPFPVTLGFLAMFLIMVIRRLTAPRAPVTASVSLGQLFINRLLFDRDIRDRKAWINRRPSEQQGKQGKG